MLNSANLHFILLLCIKYQERFIVIQINIWSWKQTFACDMPFLLKYKTKLGLYWPQLESTMLNSATLSLFLLLRIKHQERFIVIQIGIWSGKKMQDFFSLCHAPFIER